MENERLPTTLIEVGTKIQKRRSWDHRRIRRGVIAGLPTLRSNNWYYPVYWENSRRSELVMAQRIEIVG